MVAVVRRSAPRGWSTGAPRPPAPVTGSDGWTESPLPTRVYLRHLEARGDTMITSKRVLGLLGRLTAPGYGWCQGVGRR